MIYPHSTVTMTDISCHNVTETLRHEVNAGRRSAVDIEYRFFAKVVKIGNNGGINGMKLIL